MPEKETQLPVLLGLYVAGIAAFAHLAGWVPLRRVRHRIRDLKKGVDWRRFPNPHPTRPSWQEDPDLAHQPK